MHQRGPGPLGLATLGVMAVCALLPPEVRGSAAAVAALLVVLAGVLASRSQAASPAAWLLWAFVPLTLFAIRKAVTPGASVEPVALLLLAGVAGIAAAAAPRPLAHLPAVLAALAAFIGGRALYEALWGLDRWAAQLRDSAPAGEALAILNRLEQGRPYGGFSTPAALGCFLAMAVPAVAGWSFGRRGTERGVGLACATVGGAGLLATRSLGALAALAAAMALAAWRGRISSRVAVAAGAALALALLALGILRPDALLASSSADTPWRLRAGNVRIALAMARDHPLVGVGPGGFAEAFPSYRREGDNESRHAHQLPAELVAEWGIPAGLALAAVFFAVFLGPLLSTAAPPRSLESGLAVGLGAFALHSLVDFTAALPSLLLFAAVVRGYLASPPRPPSARPGARAAWIALACAAGLAVAGSGAARDALHLARQAAAEGDHAEARHLAARASAMAPWDPDPPMLGAEARLAGGDATGACVDADLAVRRAPARAAARWVRCSCRSATGDATGAYADLVEAARLYPLRREYALGRDALGASLAKASALAPR